VDATGHKGGRRLGLEDVDLSNNVSENGAETRIRAKLLTDWLNVTINSWRLVLDSETAMSNESPLMTAEAVLNKLDSFEPHIAPDVQTYTIIIDAKIAQDPSEAAPFAEQVLERMHQEASTNYLVQPNLVTYSCVINAWSKSRATITCWEKSRSSVTEDGRIGITIEYYQLQCCDVCVGKQ
jgi:hypothetical protein